MREHILVKGTVDQIPQDVVRPPERLRIRLRRLTLAQDAQIVEGEVIGEAQARAIFDSTVAIADARKYAKAFAAIAEEIERVVAGAEAVLGTRF